MALLRVKRKESPKATKRVSGNVAVEDRKTARVSTRVKQPAETYDYKRGKSEDSDHLKNVSVETTSTNAKKTKEQPTEQELFEQQMKNEEPEAMGDPRYEKKNTFEWPYTKPKPPVEPQAGKEVKPFLKKYGLWLVAAVVVIILMSRQ